MRSDAPGRSPLIPVQHEFKSSLGHKYSGRRDQVQCLLTRRFTATPDRPAPGQVTCSTPTLALDETLRRHSNRSMAAEVGPRSCATVRVTLGSGGGWRAAVVACAVRRRSDACWPCRCHPPLPRGQLKVTRQRGLPEPELPRITTRCCGVDPPLTMSEPAPISATG